MPYDFDLIVIGSGSGGGTLAYACARAGKKVLLLERGRKHILKEPAHNEQAMLIDKEPYDDRPVRVNGLARRLYMGGVLGGGSALYGAALLRPSEDDFHPGKHYGTRLPRSIWDWPVEYGALESYYSEAERLYGVSGPSDEDFGPLQKPRNGFPHQARPIKPINQKLMAANRSRGLKPFRLPLAIDFGQCLECNACPGFICPTGARRSAAQVVEKAVADNLSLHVSTNVEAEQFSLDARARVAGVCVRDRSTGQRRMYRAQRYALAAGAIHSPAILLRSGASGPLVGRHYMLHLSPITCGFFPRRTGAEETFIKQVGFADYYYGTPSYPHKMGLIQSLPVPGPLMIAKVTSPGLPRALIQFLRKRMLPLAGIIEDLPHPANRVALGKNGEPELHHTFAPYDLERGRRLGRLMSRILRNAGALFCSSKPFPSDEHVAHHCGTLRFGKDPGHAVCDQDCRMFGQPNVFVVDGCILPTSLGVGPALTIMANALRVATILTREV
jgi:choline dehydrogenase-like flavoprotein